MNINKAFYVETLLDGKTRVYNVKERFFTGKRNKGGLMERFKADESGAKNFYITQLKKDGWLPLSLEDIKKTAIDEIGIVTAYPFKHKKGFMTIEKIEALANEVNHKWESADHFTNPFSAMEDYHSFVESLNGIEHDVASLKKQVYGFMDRLAYVGAMSIIEDSFSEAKLIPDPRRFNKTAKELWRYYRHHLNDCGRLVLQKHIKASCEQFDLAKVMSDLEEINSLQNMVSDTAYGIWLERKAN